VRIKRFYGCDSSAALQAVKQEFGEAAVILETLHRPDNQDGRGVIEVVAAIDFDPALKVVCKREETDEAVPESPLPAAAADRQDARSLFVKSELEAVEPHISDLPWSGESEYRRLSAEVGQLKGMVGRLLQGSGLAGEWPHPLFAEFWEKLLYRGVSREIAGELLAGLEQRISGIRLADKPRRWLYALFEAELARLILARVSLLEVSAGARVLTLVGPTGVGKTTTLAKLAAFFRSRGERVALLSVDTFRLGAVAQIREFGRRLEVPVEIVEDRRQLFAALQGVADCERVLIDTIGRSGRDQPGLAALYRLLQGVGGDRLLVLPAALREEDLLDNLVSFRTFRARALLFTKLDETGNYGSILNALSFSGLPLSFFTGGQRVPEDLEPASGERLVDLLLDIVAPAQGEKGRS